VDSDSVWRRLITVIRSKETDDDHPDEHVIYTKPPRRRRNRIRIEGEQLIRHSDGETSNEQIIRKEDVLWYVRLAEAAGEEGKCIRNLPGEPKVRAGSIICTMLDLLPEFEYRIPGQLLSYHAHV
jgi:hypothetical protein